jgi:hypothetical protein
VVLKQAEPLRNGWLGMIPQRRIAKPEELKAVRNTDLQFLEELTLTWGL